MARRDAAPPDIDRLYQLPLAEFTAARNAMARSAGADGGAIRALAKPSLPAWAVNQLYWRRRATYDALVGRAEDLRATHDAALKGRPADLRGASRAHEAAIEDALKATIELLNESGSPATAATRQAIATTLRALPSSDPPGRLTRQLQPLGFDTLAAAATGGRVRTPAAPARFPATLKPARTKDKDRAAQARAGEEARRAAARLREAEAAARREEFEAARAARQLEKARARVSQAEAAVQQAEAELEDARRAEADILEAHKSAESRAATARERLAALQRSS